MNVISTFLDHLLVADFEPSLDTLAPFAVELFTKIEKAEQDMSIGKCDFIEIGILKGKVCIWRVFVDAYWPRGIDGRALVLD